MMRKESTAVRLLFAATAVVTLGGCATKGDLRNVQLEIRALSARQDSLMSQLRRETLSMQDTVRGQSMQLFDFPGEIFRSLREISDGLARLEALTGENQRGISSVRDQLANMRRAPATSGMGDASGGATATDPGMGDARSYYEAGVGQFNRGTLAAARSAFQQFLQAYPSHQLAPDAHFYLADILVQEDRIEDALDAFQQIPQLFPTAAKVPDAMYRVARLQVELGQRIEARATLERIVNTYPGTGVAVLAEELLREIR